MKTLSLIAGLALATSVLGQPRVPTADPAQVEARLAAVETLIERSSAAKQIEASRVPEALQRRETARTLYREAAEAFKAGDAGRASALLPQASAHMFAAAKLAAPEQVTGAKRKSDLEARLESTRALLDAQKRIAAEKSVAGGAETTRAIEKLVQQAEGEIGAGQADRASATVEQAYLLAKAAIGSMRGGDTLVRSLNFASKEEEYHYELDRNETHRMLLTVLLDQSKSARAAPFIDKAAALRQQAEGAARTGDFTGGVRMLEESTRELVRAIRGAGVYIPG